MTATPDPLRSPRNRAPRRRPRRRSPTAGIPDRRPRRRIMLKLMPGIITGDDVLKRVAKMQSPGRETRAWLKKPSGRAQSRRGLVGQKALEPLTRLFRLRSRAASRYRSTCGWLW